MSTSRCLVVCLLLAVVSEASAQQAGQTVSIPVYRPEVNIPPGTTFLAENAELLGKIWLALASVAALAVVAGVSLKLWARSKQTNDPVRLALADPWMRSKIEAMTDQQRAEFFGQHR